MKFLGSLQQRFGFTRNEARVVLFLTATFLVGLGIRWYDATVRQQDIPPFDYSLVDSEFTARSNALASLAPSPSITPTTPPVAHRKPVLKAGSVNLNTATAAQLIQLPGIGPSYAERIIAYRAEHGPFKSADELENVKGIGKKRLEQLRRFVTVEPGKQEARGKRQER
jgi:competence ComEA-like helix-hairpin-helix protein